MICLLIQFQYDLSFNKSARLIHIFFFCSLIKASLCWFKNKFVSIKVWQIPYRRIHCKHISEKLVFLFPKNLYYSPFCTPVTKRKTQLGHRRRSLRALKTTLTAKQAAKDARKRQTITPSTASKNRQSDRLAERRRTRIHALQNQVEI